MSEEICYENIYSSEFDIGRATECLRNYYIEALIYPWCINYKKMHRNYSSQMIHVGIKKNIINHKQSKIKHTCTEQKSVQWETFWDDMSFAFTDSYRIFSQSLFWINTLMVVPSNFERKTYSLRVVFSYVDNSEWIDVIIKRKEFPICQRENVSLIPLDLHRIQLLNYDISVQDEMFNRQNVLLKVNFSESVSKDVSILLTMHLKDDFKSIQGSDMNRNQKSTIETYITFSKAYLRYLIYNHEKFKYIRMTVFEANSTAILNIHRIHVCLDELQHISITYTCLNLADSCLYKCLKYVPKYNGTTFAFVYHPNMFELKLSQTCSIRSSNRPMKCRFPNKVWGSECLKGSWIEAANVCKEYGGHLPIIRSRNELHEIIALFHLTKIPPPLMTIMFIGLVNVAYEVCFLFYLPIRLSQRDPI